MVRGVALRVVMLRVAVYAILCGVQRASRRRDVLDCVALRCVALRYVVTCCDAPRPQCVARHC
eukprot:11181354-Lingulodinium_polyedra.AAC.1